MLGPEPPPLHFQHTTPHRNGYSPAGPTPSVAVCVLPVPSLGHGGLEAMGSGKTCPPDQHRGNRIAKDCGFVILVNEPGGAERGGAGHQGWIAELGQDQGGGGRVKIPREHQQVEAIAVGVLEVEVEQNQVERRLSRCCLGLLGTQGVS